MYSLLRTTSESLNKIRQRIRKLEIFEIQQSPEGDIQNGGKLWTTLHMFCT